MFLNNTIIMISFKPLWRTMERKHISQYNLIQLGIDRNTMDSLRNNRNITLITLERICELLDCEISEVVEFTNQSQP